MKFLLLITPALLFLFSLFATNNTSFFDNTTIAHADVQTTPTPTPSAIAVQKTLTYKGSTQASGIFTGRGLVVGLPSNIQAGDLLLAVAGTNGPAASWSTPQGWINGTNSGSVGSQGLTWWWKVADGTESGTKVVFTSSKYADGGIVVNVYQGAAANPIAGVSSLTTSNNWGNGHVTSAVVSGISLDASVNAVPLLFASWQSNNTTIAWPNDFIFESTATDGYSYVAIAERLSSLASNTFSGYTLPLSPAQAVVQTLQILIRVQ